MREKHRFVIVSLHWGIENVLHPSPMQQTLGRRCIDAGASVILGHHPHRLQGIERYRQGLIFYSLGNFNFMPCGVGLSPHPEWSAVADITLSGEGDPVYELVPLTIDDDYCPRPMDSKREIEAFRSHMADLSDAVAAGIGKWWWFGEISGPYLRGNAKAFVSRVQKYGPGHLFEMLRWLSSRFAIKCYIGSLLRWTRLNRVLR
jgi:poly-gamma-glutamate synthesis protein (capsule biosynthesis protein)